MRRVIGVGIVGLGARGLYFAQMYDRAAHDGFELRTLCDLNPQALEAARRRHGEAVSYHAHIETMLHQTDLDAVIVATNDPHHVGPVMAALRADKHVLVEKPLCQTLQEATMIVRQAERSRGIFLIGFELRQCVVFRRIRQLLDEGRIGSVKIGHCFDNVSVGGNYFFHDARRQKAFYQSLLLQKATHSLDLLNWFMGSRPVRVYATGGRDFFGGGRDYTGGEVELGRRCRSCAVADDCRFRVQARGLRLDYGATVEVADDCVWSRDMNLNDHSELCISYANGAHATFQECHFSPDYSREFTLVGTRGKLYGYYDNAARFLIRIEYAGDERRTEEWRPESDSGGHGGGDEGLRQEFYRRIVANNRSLEALHSAYDSTALAICAEASIESGLPVPIPLTNVGQGETS